jgi:hypothetical protein
VRVVAIIAKRLAGGARHKEGVEIPAMPTSGKMRGLSNLGRGSVFTFRLTQTTALSGREQ